MIVVFAFSAFCLLSSGRCFTVFPSTGFGSFSSTFLSSLLESESGVLFLLASSNFFALSFSLRSASFSSFVFSGTSTSDKTT